MLHSFVRSVLTVTPHHSKITIKKNYINISAALQSDYKLTFPMARVTQIYIINKQIIKYNLCKIVCCKTLIACNYLSTG
ncbi:hypothetical protein QTP88_022452 [Uroleucon formosanum]